MKNQKNKENEYCESCECTPCDCGWGTMELDKNHANQCRQEADKNKPN